MKDSIDFNCHSSFFEAVAEARKSGGKTAKKQKQHKTKAKEVAT